MLERIFTSKNRVRILQFFLFEKENSHIREISRRLKVPVSAVKREVDNLITTGILKRFENKIELNVNCSFLSDLRNIFVKTDFIFYPIRASLRGGRIDFAFVFGSFVKGSYTSESDIDLMVVGNVSLGNVIKMVSIAEKKLGREINPVVWTLRNLEKEKNTGFVKDIFKKGILMVKGDENELRKIVK